MTGLAPRPAQLLQCDRSQWLQAIRLTCHDRVCTDWGISSSSLLTAGRLSYGLTDAFDRTFIAGHSDIHCLEDEVILNRDRVAGGYDQVRA